MPVSGGGRRGILIVGEAPGKNEDEQGVQFVGDSGQLLRRELDRVGVSLDRDCWKTNSIICRPKGNKTPTDAEIDHCRPNLMTTIEELQPETVILLGGSAVRSLIGRLWSPDVGKIGRWVGWRIPDQTINAWICPTWHPSYLLREQKNRGRNQTDENDPLLIWFRRHLEAAVGTPGRPWDRVPDYAADVSIEMDTDAAAGVLGCLEEHSIDGPAEALAFDYETTTLKPDSEHARIVSCSVAWSDIPGIASAIAYPCVGAARDATSCLLRSKVPKIASNKNFEERWTRREFKHGVRNWAWDTMLNAHVADNRPGITSIKFQAYVLLGQPLWNRNIEPYFKSADSNSPNRIGDVPIEDLLLYNGLDALLEFRVAFRQAELLGVKII